MRLRSTAGRSTRYYCCCACTKCSSSIYIHMYVCIMLHSNVQQSFGTGHCTCFAILYLCSRNCAVTRLLHEQNPKAKMNHYRAACNSGDMVVVQQVRVYQLNDTGNHERYRITSCICISYITYSHVCTRYYLLFTAERCPGSRS